jgi:hypothetical protein
MATISPTIVKMLKEKKKKQGGTHILFVII